MYFYCYHCWSDFEEASDSCPNCGKELSSFSALNFHEKLIRPRSPGTPDFTTGHLDYWQPAVGKSCAQVVFFIQKLSGLCNNIRDYKYPNQNRQRWGC